MRPEIAEINSRYEIFQDYVYPTTEFIKNLINEGEEKLAEHRKLGQLHKPEYEILVKRVLEIIKDFEAAEVAEAYTNGCRLLQMNLSGFMANNFCDDYYAVMVNAIHAQHFHTSWLFLQAIANNVGEKVSPLI